MIKIKKILKYLRILFIVITIVGCSNINKSNKKWIKINKPYIYLDLRPGDIVIKERKISPLKIFGHVGIMKTNRIIVEYPKLGEIGYEIDIASWLEKDRDILILRYKNMNKHFQKKLIKNIKSYERKPYKLFFKKGELEGFYCSEYIWYMYKITGFQEKKAINIDSDKGKIIFPYDFINSDFLKQINYTIN